MNIESSSSKILSASAAGKWFYDNRMAIVSYFLVTLTAVIFMTLEVVLSDGILSRDSCSYLLYVQKALNSSWEEAAAVYPQIPSFPPLLMILMYQAGKLGIDVELAGRTLNLLGIIFLAWGLLCCCRKLYREPLPALCSALMLIALPKIYLEGCDIMRDPLYWALSVWTLALILKRSEKPDMTNKKYFLSFLGISLLLGLASLTRKEGVFLTALTLLWTIILNKASWQKKLLSVLLIILITAGILLLPKMLGVPWNMLDIFSTLEDINV